MKSSKKNGNGSQTRKAPQAPASSPDSEAPPAADGAEGKVAAYTGAELTALLLQAGKLEKQGQKLIAEAGAIYLDALRRNGGGPYTLAAEDGRPSFMLSRCKGAGEGGVERGFRKSLTQFAPTVLG